MRDTKVSWAKVIWTRTSIPRHAFISWIYVQHRLPTKVRLSRFSHQNDLQCLLCGGDAEDDTHLFSTCPYAMEVWNSIRLWWPIPSRSSGNPQEVVFFPLIRSKAPKAHMQISCAITATTIYFIWYARNQLMFKNLRLTVQHTVSMIKAQIRHRILFLNSLSCTYSLYVDRLLS